MGFIHITVIDIIDIILVALVLYYLYTLIRGTRATSIIWGVLVIYIIWVVVKALNMELLSSILGNITSVGIIALIVVFQPEIRQFLQVIGDTSHNKGHTFLGKLFGKERHIDTTYIDAVVDACTEMSNEQTGALIVIKRDGNLNEIKQSGVNIDAEVSSSLLRNLFFKNSPLHDGAVVIEGGRIASAKCVLPSTRSEVPLSFGMRHRAAMGLSEVSDALTIVVSEQTGTISIAIDGTIRRNLTGEKLKEIVLDNLIKK